jgi:hypothetical protein
MKSSYECFGCIADCDKCHELEETENDKQLREITKLPDWKWIYYD